MNLRTDGFIVIRGVIDPIDIDALRLAAEWAYSAVSNPQTDLERTVASDTLPWGGIPIPHVLTISGDDAVAAAFDRIVKVGISAISSHGGFRSAIYRPEASYVRRHMEHATHIPWHFDSGAAGTREFDPCFNVWVPFQNVGDDRPSLEFCAGSHRIIRDGVPQHRPGYPSKWAEIHVTLANHIKPKLSVGDIAVFDHYILHRTQQLDGLPRMSAEIRFTAIGKVPALLRPFFRRSYSRRDSHI